MKRVGIFCVAIAYLACTPLCLQRSAASSIFPSIAQAGAEYENIEAVL